MNEGVGLNVKIDKEAVEAQIVSAIMQSSIGTHLQKAIDEALEKPEGYGKQSWLEKTIKHLVEKKIEDIIQVTIGGNEDLKKKVEAAVIEGATDDVINQLISKAFRNY